MTAVEAVARHMTRVTSLALVDCVFDLFDATHPLAPALRSLASLRPLNLTKAFLVTSDPAEDAPPPAAAFALKSLMIGPSIVSTAALGWLLSHSYDSLRVLNVSTNAPAELADLISRTCLQLAELSFAAHDLRQTPADSTEYVVGLLELSSLQTLQIVHKERERLTANDWTLEVDYTTPHPSIETRPHLPELVRNFRDILSRRR